MEQYAAPAKAEFCTAETVYWDSLKNTIVSQAISLAALKKDNKELKEINKQLLMTIETLSNQVVSECEAKTKRNPKKPN